MSTWSISRDDPTTTNSVPVQTTAQEKEMGQRLEKQPDTERPSKRRRLSSPTNHSDSTSAEIVVEGSDVLATNLKKTKAFSVVKLTVTSDGQHVVAVTGEDKCIHVFDLLANGSLQQLSERQMPKKPCALVLTTDESTILCADKFGDVYSLPLLGHPTSSDVEAPDVVRDPTEQDSKQPAKAFVPAATSLTVHTRRNQQALKNQQKTKAKAAQKQTLSFEHQLLLGHVSLLTDLACVTVTSKGHPKVPPRSYILTSDRDEHIRVSRGLPQAHVIEGYCLGHTEFVSKLCILPWNKDLLVSGGGDGTLILWDWLNGVIKQRLDLRHDVEAPKRSARRGLNGITVGETGAKGYNAKIAVSGIWALQYKDEQSALNGKEIVVTCEGIASLFFYNFDSEGTMQFGGSISVGGNIIDVAILEITQSQASIIYSMDNIHDPNSTTVMAVGNASRERPYVGTLSRDPSSYFWNANEVLESVVDRINWIARSEELGGEAESDGSALRELIYGIEHLRKRGQGE